MLPGVMLKSGQSYSQLTCVLLVAASVPKKLEKGLSGI